MSFKFWEKIARFFCVLRRTRYRRICILDYLYSYKYVELWKRRNDAEFDPIISSINNKHDAQTRLKIKSQYRVNAAVLQTIFSFLFLFRFGTAIIVFI